MNQKLSNDVFPHYQRLAETGFDFDRILWTQSPLNLLTDDGGLKQALIGWASEFNAVAEWMIVGAFRTMRDWHVAPDGRSRLQWDSLHAHDGRGVAIGEKFEFHYPAWDVQLSRWPVYRRSLLEKFDEAVAEYEQKTRAAAETLGLIRAPTQV